jgi:exopolyphosphatase/guanosine-5'-triphosphate,3'-diphosphate pyrophosphatase
VSTKVETLAPPVRVGVVDMGSNAIRIQVAEIRGTPPTIRSLEAQRAPVRLGRDVFLSGRVPEATIEAAIEVLQHFRDACDRHGVERVEAIATSAMRDARNQTEVLQRIRAETGVEIRVISGADEAFLLHAAVCSKVDLAKGRSVLVDLGGGSVEVSLVADGEILNSESYRLGALRVLHALEADFAEPSGESFLGLLEEYVRTVEGRIRDHLGKGAIDRYVATGGNIDSIADLLGKEGRTQLVGGVEACALDDLKELTGRLARLSYVERMETFGLRPDRADTILPAAVVYYRIGLAARASHVLVPRVGMRDGLLQEIALGHARQRQAVEHRDSVLSACREIGRRYRVDGDHAETVRRLAVRLFDQTADLHRLGAEERTLLEAAALLHDVGVFVNNAKHHKHSWYLIRESDIVGLGDEEREIVALCARYHRRAHPSPRHYGWGGLTAEDQQKVRKLSAILRVADGLDRSHQGKVADVEVAIDRKAVDLLPVLGADVESNLVLERLGFQDKSRLFQEVYGRRVQLGRPRKPSP